MCKSKEHPVFDEAMKMNLEELSTHHDKCNCGKKCEHCVCNERIDDESLEYKEEEDED